MAAVEGEEEERGQQRGCCIGDKEGRNVAMESQHAQQKDEKGGVAMESQHTGQGKVGKFGKKRISFVANVFGRTFFGKKRILMCPILFRTLHAKRKKEHHGYKSTATSKGKWHFATG